LAQLPQLATSAFVSTQLWPQALRPVAQVSLQPPSEQSWGETQALPQEPQLRLFCVKSTQPVAQVVIGLSHVGVAAKVEPPVAVGMFGFDDSEEHPATKLKPRPRPTPTPTQMSEKDG
jgi:hypothetical protein